MQLKILHENPCIVKEGEWGCARSEVWALPQGGALQITLQAPPLAPEVWKPHLTWHVPIVPTPPLPSNPSGICSPSLSSVFQEAFLDSIRPH